MIGWIKLNRDFLESKQFANPIELKIWLWLMLKASTVDRFALLKIGKGNTTVEVKRGQLIFGRNKAEAELKIDGSTIYRTLQRFQDEKIISIKANNQFSIITVFDFIESQDFSETENSEFEEIEQPMNKQRTTNEQAKNNQRTSNEQVTNTVKESLESKESLEFEESKKSKEVNAPAGNLFGDPDVDKKQKNGKPKNGAAHKTISHLFRNSEYFDIEKIRLAIQGTQYEAANVEYYFECLLNWSDSKGEKKTDWLATAKNWMLRDLKEGKFVDLNYKPKNRTNGTYSNSKGIGDDPGRKPIRDVTQQDIVNALNQKFGDE